MELEDARSQLCGVGETMALEMVTMSAMVINSIVVGNKSGTRAAGMQACKSVPDQRRCDVP